jgi:hypothetical protein
MPLPPKTLTIRSLKKAMTAGKSLPSLNSLIYDVCRGPVHKDGTTIVSGILHRTGTIHVIASRGPVKCFETSQARVKSRVFESIDTFRLPPAPRNAEYYLDYPDPVENVGIWFLFESVPICCGSFVSSAIIVGTEPLLREALKGRHYIPRAYFADYAAMELQP